MSNYLTKKTTIKKENCCSNTVFSLFFTSGWNSFAPLTTSFFSPLSFSASPKSVLQFNFKNHENVWTDLKRDSAPIQFKLKRKKPLRDWWHLLMLPISKLLSLDDIRRFMLVSAFWFRCLKRWPSVHMFRKAFWLSFQWNPIETMLVW